MELFDKNGHLTNEALAALDSNALDELTRLEVSEHLSFCEAEPLIGKQSRRWSRTSPIRLYCAV